MPLFDKVFIAFSLDTENMATRKPTMPVELLFERILSGMVVFGLATLCIGLLLHIIGRSLGDSIVARIGAYILVIGIVLIAARLFYWIMEKIVGRGLDATLRQDFAIAK